MEICNEVSLKKENITIEVNYKEIEEDINKMNNIKKNIENEITKINNIKKMVTFWRWKKYEDFNHKIEVFQVKIINKIFYDGKVALKGVSFNLYKNEIFCLLLGHDDTGKSILINYEYVHNIICYLMI